MKGIKILVPASLRASVLVSSKTNWVLLVRKRCDAIPNGWLVLGSIRLLRRFGCFGQVQTVGRYRQRVSKSFLKETFHWVLLGWMPWFSRGVRDAGVHDAGAPSQ